MMYQSCDVDDQIERDLDSLGELTARSIPDFAETVLSLSSEAGPYRSGSEGAVARRQHLLALRQRELALMPLRTQRIFVRRVARAAAGAVGAAAGIGIGLSVFAPGLARRLAVDTSALMALTTTALAVTCAYVAAARLAEWWFERVMERAVTASDDPYADIELFTHSGPMRRARRLVRSADSWSVGLPLLALAMLTPLAELLLLRGTSGFGDTLRANLGYLWPAMVAYVDVAAVLAWLCYTRTPSAERALRASEGAGGLAAVVAFCLVALMGATPFLAGYASTAQTPGEGVRWLLAMAGVGIVFAPVAWMLLRWRRREDRTLSASLDC